MPNLTKNLNLKKPLLSEAGDVEVINENMDLIDAAFECLKEIIIEFTLLASAWSASKTYTITEPRITENTEGELVEGNNSDVEHTALAKACISRETVISAGQLVITARGTLPTINVKVKLKVRKF